MKNKPVFWIIVTLSAALIIACAVFGKQYYENRYVATDYYAMVPLDYDMSPVPMLDMHGNELGAGIEYRLTAYNEQGEAKPVVFSVHDLDSDYSRGEPQPQPGEYLFINASKQIVISWYVIGVTDVPQKALDMIKAGS